MYRSKKGPCKKRSREAQGRGRRKSKERRGTAGVRPILLREDPQRSRRDEQTTGGYPAQQSPVTKAGRNIHMRRQPPKGLTAVLHGYADQHIAAMTSMGGSWIGNCETKSSDMLKAAYSTAIAQLSTPDITRLCSSVADLYQKIPEDTKKQ